MSFRRITLNPHGIAAKLGTSKENTKEKGRIFQDFLSLTAPRPSIHICLDELLHA